MKFADIIVDISHEKLDRSFQYHVPEIYQDQIEIGMVALIPFGNGKNPRKGYVIGLSDEPRIELDKIKDISGLCTEMDTTESRLIALASWMKENYGSTMIQALKTVLPIQEKVKAKEKRTLLLAVDKNTADNLLIELEKGRGKARARFLKELIEKEKLDYTWCYKELGITSAVIDFFLKKGIVKMEYDELYRIPVDGSDILRTDITSLNECQRKVAESILEEWNHGKKRPVLLHGVTGSGKTQVYMKLIEHVVSEGRQAILLIPEIALTYQTVRRFYGRFGDKVSVLNSKLSKGERYDQFKRAKRGEIQVMVGPRSALFTPFNNLGLIIIDEEHENSYKSETTPRYHAREIAIKRAQMENARVLLGSATPSLEAYTKAVSGEYHLEKLTGRYEERSLPEVKVIDLREELKAGNRSIFSNELVESMEACLEKNEQIMLFLNRRGYTGFVSCRSCGHVMKCPHCDVSMSEHREKTEGFYTKGRLVCHYCGYEIPMPDKCPSCGSSFIGGFKAGTQQIEEGVKKIFPSARILRMDYDTTRTKGSYEEILDSFAKHKADILIGTQMIVKGHDFPDVTLVGILAADMSLNAADYRCAERTFQLLTQAVGRAGRGEKKGKAIIQTYSPEHYSIQAAISQDYDAFYNEEIAYREILEYPPVSHMLGIMGASEDEELLKKGMYYLSLFIQKYCQEKELRIIGPTAEAVGKIKDVYRQIIYLKHDSYDKLIEIKNQLEKYMEINYGFRNIYIQFDFT